MTQRSGEVREACVVCGDPICTLYDLHGWLCDEHAAEKAEGLYSADEVIAMMEAEDA